MKSALKLLPYSGADSIVLLHDFWGRHKAYKVVLDFYYVVGYVRSVVALKKNGDLDSEVERMVYEKYMKREYLTWHDTIYDSGSIHRSYLCACCVL